MVAGSAPSAGDGEDGCAGGHYRQADHDPGDAIDRARREQEIQGTGRDDDEPDQERERAQGADGNRERKSARHGVTVRRRRDERKAEIRAGRKGGELPRLRVLVVDLVTAFGIAALTFMMLMYAFESRGHGFVLAFAVGCALSSAYGFMSGAWPFGVVEAVWCLIALRRFSTAGPT
jgi:hypothetical protein